MFSYKNIDKILKIIERKVVLFEQHQKKMPFSLSIAISENIVLDYWSLTWVWKKIGIVSSHELDFVCGQLISLHSNKHPSTDNNLMNCKVWELVRVAEIANLKVFILLWKQRHERPFLLESWFEQRSFWLHFCNPLPRTNLHW